jgi:hypothetical protein
MIRAGQSKARGKGYRQPSCSEFELDKRTIARLSMSGHTTGKFQRCAEGSVATNRAARCSDAILIRSHQRNAPPMYSCGETLVNSPRISSAWLVPLSNGFNQVQLDEYHLTNTPANHLTCWVRCDSDHVAT